MHYSLQCVFCGTEYQEGYGPFRLECDNHHRPALLRAVYENKEFLPDREAPGMFRFRNWLPVRRSFPNAAGTLVFHSKELSSMLKLDNVYVAFNGYWPEKGAGMETCSFKELEALSVCGRMTEEKDSYMVVASAGNTGRAFLQIGSLYNIPVCVVVPESALPEMWITTGRGEKVLLVAVAEADYFDAIRLSSVIASLPGFYPEGGAKNVARRDGMGSVLLSAVEQLGVMPDHYFQSVGSGTGGIAAWEMSVRLRETGRYGKSKMRLHLVQNQPFSVIHDAWSARSSEILPFDDDEAKRNIDLLWSPVLSNRKPPYSISGGVYDALSDTGGETYAVSADEARAAGRMFTEKEGIDLDPAAEVAVAGLIRASAAGRLGKEDVVLLNVTGGGGRHPQLNEKRKRVTPDIIFQPGVTGREIESGMAGLITVGVLQ